MRIIRYFLLFTTLLLANFACAAEMPSAYVDFVLKPSRERVYWLDRGQREVVIASFATGEIIKRMTLPKAHGLHKLTFDNTGRKIYIADEAKNIFVLDANKEVLLGKVALKPQADADQGPSLVIVAPIQNQLYVADAYGQFNEAAKLHSIDTVKDTVFQTADKPHGAYGAYFGWIDGAATINNAGTKIYLTSAYDNGIYRFDTARNQFDMIDNFPGYNYIALLLQADEQKLLGLTDRQLNLIDLKTGATQVNLLTGRGFHDLCHAHSVHKIFISDVINHKIIVLNDENYQVIGTINLAIAPAIMRLSIDEEILAVADGTTRQMIKIDTAENSA